MERASATSTCDSIPPPQVAPARGRVWGARSGRSGGVGAGRGRRAAEM
jgi:hypothetical protein